jgi:hypothetical protein
MIIIVDLNRTVVGQFQNFNKLFECFITLENLKFAPKDPGFKQMDSNFTVFSSKKIATLYANTQQPLTSLIEAYEENLPLIEICTGDYRFPLHVALTPNVDIDYWQKKWYMDWCTCRNLLVREL